VTHRTSKRDAILKTATGLFAEKGFQETSMGEVSKLTGVAGGTVFYHFKNKEELFVSILEEARDRLVRELERFFSAESSEVGLDMVQDVLSFYLHLASGEMRAQFLILHRDHAFRLATQHLACRVCLGRIYESILEIFEQALVRGQADGSITGDCEPRRTALILLALADGLVRLMATNLYEPGVLLDDVLAGCRRMLAADRAAASNPESKC